MGAAEGGARRPQRVTAIHRVTQSFKMISFTTVNKRDQDKIIPKPVAGQIWLWHCSRSDVAGDKGKGGVQQFERCGPVLDGKTPIAVMDSQ